MSDDCPDEDMALVECCLLDPTWLVTSTRLSSAGTCGGSLAEMALAGLMHGACTAPSTSSLGGTHQVACHTTVLQVPSQDWCTSAHTEGGTHLRRAPPAQRRALEWAACAACPGSLQTRTRGPPRQTPAPAPPLPQLRLSATRPVCTRRTPGTGWKHSGCSPSTHTRGRHKCPVKVLLVCTVQLHGAHCKLKSAQSCL